MENLFKNIKKMFNQIIFCRKSPDKGGKIGVFSIKKFLTIENYMLCTHYIPNNMRNKFIRKPKELD